MGSVTEETGKFSHSKSLDDVIYPEIEPGIISKDMIKNAYLEDGHKGECARLHKLQPVVYERIAVLRLENRNILRIDHLWILTNLTKLSLGSNRIETIEHIEMLTELKELDLSFNFIEKIENLQNLVKLEVLTLFNNLITKIENLDSLERLVILSLGNNEIDSLKGIERLRFLKDLKVLNLEGNPISKQADFCLSDYIAAVLPNVKYYEYKAITNEIRTAAKEKFYRELREIETNEEMEIIDRAHRAKEERDAEMLASSFVEHLNEHQLYQSLWKGDEDGRVLMMIGLEVETLSEEYDKDIFDITQEIYKFGLVRYAERDLEIKEFMSNLEEGQEEIQNMGKTVIEDFMTYKEQVFDRATELLTEYEDRIMRGEEEESPDNLELHEEYEKTIMQFEDTVNDVWQQLMSQELHLHEAIEEATINFQRTIQEMMSKFVEQAQTYFGQLRDVALHFSENMAEIATRYVSTKLALQDFADVPSELQHCMEDREAIMNLIAGMKDTHIQKIDEREDRLMTRSKKFIDEMVEKLNQDELERNRSKILEINTFLETLTDSLHNMHHEIHQKLLNEE